MIKDPVKAYVAVRRHKRGGDRFDLDTVGNLSGITRDHVRRLDDSGPWRSKLNPVVRIACVEIQEIEEV